MLVNIENIHFMKMPALQSLELLPDLISVNGNDWLLSIKC